MILLSEIAMPKTSLASMSVEALFKLRDGVAAALSEALKKEHRSLGEDMPRSDVLPSMAGSAAAL